MNTLRLPLLVALVMASVFHPHVSYSQTSEVARSRSVTVSGSCIRSSLPDRGAVILTAVFLEKEISIAAKKAMDEYEKLKKAVTSLKLKDVELATTESSFQEEHEWQKDRQVFKGYRARMGLKVSTSETARLGEVISLAAKQGIRDVGGLQLFISPEKMNAEREACLVDAVKNAKSKADAIAKAASAKLGRVLLVDEIGNGFVPPPRQPILMQAKRMEMAADMASSAPQIDAEAEKIVVNVQVSYALE